MYTVTSKTKLSILSVLTLLACAKNSAASPGDLVKEFPLVGHSFAMDKDKNIVYMSVTGSNSVAVIDMNTLALTDSIFVGSNPQGMAVSRDGKILYVATAGASSLAVVDLSTKTLLAPVPLPRSARDVEVDDAGRVYAASASSSYRSIMVYDPADGLVTEPFGSCSACYLAMLEMSPDGKTLFAANQGLSPGTLAKYDVSGYPPALIWQNGHGDLGSNGQDICLTPTGEHVYYAVGGGNEISGNYDIAKIDSNGMGVLGSFVTGAYPREIVTSPDGKIAYAVHTSGHIDVWNADTFLKIRDYVSTGEASELFVDKTGHYLLAAFPTGLRVYEAEGSAVIEDEDGDGIDDLIDNCLGLYNPDQSDRDNDKIGDLCDQYPDNPDNALAQCESESAELQKQLDSCLSRPLLNDADGDGEYDATDRCPDTPRGAAVDDSGCSIVQFCIKQTSSAAACKGADWENDEPTSSSPGDCIAVKTDRKSFNCQPHNSSIMINRMR